MSAKSNEYVIRIKRSAEKEMDHLPAEVFNAIVKATLALEANPRPAGSKKLRGSDKYRLRAGDYRILYTIDDVHCSVEVVAVGNRKEVYRGL